MEYQRFGDTLYVRMDRGEEIMDGLHRLALAEHIHLASVSGLGAINEFSVGIYEVDTRQYNNYEFTGAHEITSLTGTINTLKGKFYAHIHISAANATGAVVGGHMNSARISGTGELVIRVTDGVVDREKDEATGLSVFSFSAGKKL